jgi:hypothetical protein
VWQASVHVLHISTKEEERGMFPESGTDCLKGGGQGVREIMFTGKSPRLNISMGQDEQQGSRTEVQKTLEGVPSVGDQRAKTRPVLEFG